MATQKPHPFDESKKIFSVARGEIAESHQKLSHGDRGPAVAGGFALFRCLPHDAQQEIISYIKHLNHFGLSGYVSVTDVKLIASGKLDAIRALDKAKRKATKE